MSSNRSKNFRRRIDDDDNDDANANGTTTPSTITTTVKSSAKHSTSTTAAKPKKGHQKLLSFADDEETDTPISRPSSKSASSSSYRLSKPSSSHKITSTKERHAPSPVSVPSNVQPQAGQYTKEALRELQKNTKTLASSRPQDPRPSTASAEPVVILRGLLKPVAEKEKDGDDELEEERGIRAKDQGSLEDENERRLGLIGIGKAGREVEGGLGSVIPDQATINAIRAKRERLRKSRAAAPDFISLDGGSNHGAAEGLSDEEPEFQTRIAMLGEKIDGGRKGVFEDFDERSPSAVRGAQMSTEVVDDDEDEEERKWEEEQFRKGLGKRMDDGSTMVSANPTIAQPIQQPRFMYQATPVPPYSAVSGVAVGSPTLGGSIGGLQGFETMTLAQQADIARKALQDSLGRLKETHGRTMTSVTRADENLSTALTNIVEFENKLSAAGEKFIFMQKLRDFVSVICEFLQHKAPYIEELEEQMQQLNKERASANLERRAADNDDITCEVEAAVNAAMYAFSKGGGSSSSVVAASKAAETALQTIKERRLPVELDETGRDMNLKRRMDMARRAEARERRKMRSDRKRILSIANGNSYQRIEGESSSDESEGECAAYQSHRDLLIQTAEQVFSDAAEEFSELSVVKDRFETWKRSYSSSYRDAYISLSIPAIFSPYVRLELLKWDPLHETVDFNAMKWHKLLFDYGAPEDGVEFSPDDADADLVPGLVEKIALPLLHHDLSHCWDILSTRETENAVAATNLVISYLSASSEALKDLIVAIRARLSDAVANLVVPTWSGVVVKAVPTAARVAAYQFGVAVRLMRNICLWKDILALPILEKLALDELLAGKMLPHIRMLTSDVHDAITRTERVVDSLSGVWSGRSITGARSSHKLQPLVDYVLTLGKVLEKKHASGGAESEISGLARRLKKMLVELNEYDEARAVSRAFQLKEAL